VCDIKVIHLSLLTKKSFTATIMPVTTLLPLTRPISRLSKLHPSTTFTRLYSAPTSTTIPASKQKYIPTSGNYPLGFLASSTHVGVKKSNTSTNDVALLVSETPCAAAAVFTTNKFQAAPVTVTREMLRARKGEGVRAVVVNSGCANAVTGKGGLEDARRMGKETDRALGEGDGKGMASVVMSTGVIGQRYVWWCGWQYSRHELMWRAQTPNRPHPLWHPDRCLWPR